MEWEKLLSELRAQGMTQQAIAAECRCSQSTISEISRGKQKDPAYSIGKRLVDLHAEKHIDKRPDHA